MRAGILGLGLAAAAAALPALAQDVPPAWRHGPGMMWDGGWGWMMLLGPLMMILFVAAIIVLVVIALRWLGGQPTHGAGPPAGRTPLDILKERFARGEIDKAEFEERRRVLGE
jgi:putative membrane protein